MYLNIEDDDANSNVVVLINSNAMGKSVNTTHQHFIVDQELECNLANTFYFAIFPAL